ncbi:hypothetical protein [Bacteroidetes bacterium endosymbiont of Geopemphigus sp.]|uniref:hypothetical protein n=1 Tax=Bacteroidetes bacterium endosymbiont of Geopemphigus sp. TaxID=2047937 RepID=UPI000CD14361|nr:hypothetical protein [Bacteroidetes bacterium endosymbiont of Geopemphigus sp.]
MAQIKLWKVRWSARRYVFYQRLFEDFSTQRNHALDLAAHQWVLFIDADERLNKILKDESFKSSPYA